jgi:hypothetical protein
MLKKGGFPLRKWCSNHPAVLKAVQPEDREIHCLFRLDNDGSVKTLGLHWHPVTDNFQFSLCLKDMKQNTNRTVLAVVASIFDPLGLLGPIIVRCKVFLRTLWQHKLEWDELLPAQLHTMWSRIYQQLPCISNIKVERLVTGSARRASLQLHGFCDASITAYGTCIYIRSTYEEGNITTRLLCSKSRIAPLRQVSLPRLELCEAVLLVNLVHKTTKALQTNINSVHLWTDSTIVLAWLAAPATRWKVYVANRVAEIQRLMEIEAGTWKHVSSENNPADIISRGVYPIDFQEYQMVARTKLALRS